MHATINALAAPPNESINSIVSLESQYGICYLLLFLSLKQEITLPSIKRDLLIFPVSLTISPYDSDSFNLSDPARSTKDIFPYFFKTWSSSSFVSDIRYTVRIEWDLDESAFSLWLPVFQFLIPSFKTAIRSSFDVHSTTVRSSTKKPFYTFHLIWRIPLSGLSKSYSCSL